ncbi:hypothetical protein [Dactylosporangium sp. NPDC000521]|uniref:hypothetical protein n=1 Tax=Dactylosporangium sp. NPDC000521 TaxID=3363975 RepID=UPI0036B31361
MAGLQRVPVPNRDWLDWGAETYAGRGLVVQVTQPGGTFQPWMLTAGARRREHFGVVERFAGR